jgi:sodium transport system permease protein
MFMSGPVKELYRQELRMFLRDRRAVVLSIILPVVVMPLLLFGSHWSEQQRKKELQSAIYHYSLSGPEAGQLRAVLDQAIKPPDSGEQAGTAEFREVAATEPEKALQDEEIDFYIEALESHPADPSAASGATTRRGPERDPEEGVPSILVGRDLVPLVLIYYRANRDSSRHAASEMWDRLLEYRRQSRYGLLQDRGFPFQLEQLGPVTERDLATAQQAAGVYVGRFLTLFILFFLLIGGSAVAIDSIAGEKERGTLETLLTTSIRRSDIILGKMLLVLTVAFVITLLQVANLLVYIGFRIIELPEGLSVGVSPAMALLLLIIYLPVILLVSALLLLMSGTAKTYKEAQLYFMPLFFLALLPAVAPLFPGLQLRSVLVLVPIANVSLGVKELLVGRYDWPMLAAAWIITLLTGLAVTRRLTNTLSQERLITVSDTDHADLQGGPALFPRRVLRWFGVMWVIMLAVFMNVPILTTLERQIVFNVIILFAGGSLLMAHYYRLNLAEALALRKPRWPVWPAVLVGAPASLIVGHGVFLLTNQVIPVPRQILETFAQYVLPAEYPLWYLLILIAVVPGIGEEIAFRGVLLHGLRRRFHPVVLALVVGGIFGFFHVALFRIPPTAFLGIVLAAVTLLTGSIFPAMLWHALVNGTSVLLARSQMSPEGLAAVEILGGLGGLVLAFLVIWRFRTPYPDLRKRG